MIEVPGYVHRQFTQRGETIDFEVVQNYRIVGDQHTYLINAANKNLFILNLTALPVGTKIISDSNVTVTEGPNVPLDRIEEYSGIIHIILPGSVAAGDVFNVLFYKVIPKR